MWKYPYPTGVFSQDWIWMWVPSQTVGLFYPTLHKKRGTHILMWKYPCSTFSNVEQGYFHIKILLCENTPIKHYPMLNMKNNVWSDILNVKSMRWFSHKIKSPCENTPIKMTLFTIHIDKHLKLVMHRNKFEYLDCPTTKDIKITGCFFNLAKLTII